LGEQATFKLAGSGGSGIQIAYFLQTACTRGCGGDHDQVGLKEDIDPNAPWCGPTGMGQESSRRQARQQTKRSKRWRKREKRGKKRHAYLNHSDSEARGREAIEGRLHVLDGAARLGLAPHGVEPWREDPMGGGVGA
jgi:hypothetical protein